MLVDRKPCPACERVGFHPPEATTLDVSDTQDDRALHRLWFRCRRCGARWPSSAERTERIVEHHEEG